MLTKWLTIQRVGFIHFIKSSELISESIWIEHRRRENIRVEKEVDEFFPLISSWQLVKMFWWRTAGLSRGHFKEVTHIDERLHLKTHLECVCVYFLWMFLIPCVISRKDWDLKTQAGNCNGHLRVCRLFARTVACMFSVTGNHLSSECLKGPNFCV